jgi:protein CpxP
MKDLEQLPHLEEGIRMNRLTTGRAFLLVGALVIGISQLVAQPQRGGGVMMSPEERAKQLQERLKLTDEQTAKITKIYQASQNEFSEKMPELMGDREGMRKAMGEMTEKNDKAIEKLLTKDQTKKYAEVKKEREEMMQRRMERRPNQ